MIIQRVQLLFAGREPNIGARVYLRRLRRLGHVTPGQMLDALSMATLMRRMHEQSLSAGRGATTRAIDRPGSDLDREAVLALRRRQAWLQKMQFYKMAGVGKGR